MDLDAADDKANGDDAFAAARSTTIPGDLITDDPQFMRGHGTYILDQSTQIKSSLIGTVSRVNKLLSITPFKSRFLPEIGDLVVGVIKEVGLKRWKVDIGARQDAILQLASINLPGGIQRRKTGTDELAMRSFFEEGDLLLAEVQNYFGDGSVSLHTRSLKYGKLRNGQFVRIAPQHVQRSKTSAVQLGQHVDLVLGSNGFCHVSLHSDTSLTGSANTAAQSGYNAHNNTTQEASERIYSNINADIPARAREDITRVRNILQALDMEGIRMDAATMKRVYEASQVIGDVWEIMSPDMRKRLAAEAAFSQ
ncbi:exosome complex exonuclease RRP4 [Protomyces lactucae-debilis]|uniref:Exosome complex exonuclease RRP4 n=1 Tax=Protomyces lactucae-debilis TaxID=2754530 RepID=A0A1Y2FCD1_PROLT|nr:exosome complex exonuclease RRP4 [Protomyces lactucae-debilis]ORY80515.1 exosome complex exonuclease RRP4 [Protomyces lactucae-debilis]